MPNLLTRALLEDPSDLCQLYVVLDGKDYRTTFATLLRLVTKATVGLDRVNNTSDAEKPISSQQQDALNLKADKDSVATKDQLDQLTQQLQGYVTQEALQQAIQQITTALNGYTTANDVAAIIQNALSPVEDGISQLTVTVQNQQQQLQNIMSAGYVTSSQLGEISANILTQANQTAASKDQALMEAVDEQITNIRETVTALNQTLEVFRAAYESHTHTPEEIEGLTEFVRGLVGEHPIILGPHQW